MPTPDLAAQFQGEQLAIELNARRAAPTPSICVYGPRGCGKTRNAQRLLRALNLTQVIDDFPRPSIPKHGALVLSDQPEPGMQSIPFTEAMQRVSSTRGAADMVDEVIYQQLVKGGAA